MLIVVCFSGCGSPVDYPLQTTFYHWQTRLAPDSTARALLAEYNCDRLYAKAFDVVWQAGRPEPTALLELADTTGLPTLVPVVFITNEVMKNYPTHKMPQLAADILGLTRELLREFPELQLDCDWTARTRVPYFTLLSAMRELLGEVPLSCTVRLHQYRDTETQGIPPLERATLMAYNVGDLNRWETENSIVDTTILKQYLAGADDYPLDLDLAVAVYDWVAVYRRGNLTYLINEPELAELTDTARFALLSPNRWTVKQSTYLDGLYLYAGDQLRREIAPPELVGVQTEVLRRHVPGFPGQRLMVYRLGSRLWAD